MTFKEGDTLGRYTINRLIGRGGWGEVYEAVDPELDRLVALKLLTSKLALDPGMQERFAREARTVAAIDHPNIVTIHSVEEVEGHRFLTMQLVRGQNLSKLIPESGMPLEELFRVAIPLADAIAAAHARGVTHRDIKPANVMVADDGQVKVLDFGLAKLIPEHDTEETLISGPTPAGSVLGTVNYMSPEQLRGEEADQRSDIFALGVVLYQMATGAVPYQGKSSLDVAASILRDRPTEVTAIRRALPRHLGRIIRTCLAEAPDNRYQSALDVRRELENLRQEVETGVSAPYSSLAGGRLRRWRLPLVAGALALLAVVGGFLLGRDGSSPPPPSAGASTAVETSRIVVLPFEDMGEPAVDYFASGLTEEISSRLAAVQGLGVISRISANQYVGTSKTPRQIGDELQVAYILRGSVQWAANGDGPTRVRIRPNLIRVADDTQIQIDPYLGSVDDIFEVQEEIASRVAKQLGRRLTGGGGDIAEERPTPSLEAYQAYLRGLHYVRRPIYSPEYSSQAVAGFSEAVAIDPEFALAWAWLSRAHSMVVLLGLDTTPERQRQAREAMERATELAADAPEVRIARAYYRYWVEKDYDAALEEFDFAESRLPDHYEIHEGKGYLLRRRGQWEDAVANLERAFSLNPRAAGLAAEIGDTHSWKRDYDEALRWSQQSIALDPEQVWAYYTEALALELRDGDLAAARATLERMPPSDSTLWVWTWFWFELLEERPDLALARLPDDDEPWVQGWDGVEPVALLRAQAQELAGQPDAARASYEEAERLLLAELERAPDDSRLVAGLGLTYAGLGRDDEAIRQTRRAAELLPVERDAISGTNHLIELAQVYARTGRRQEAVELLERLLAQPAPISAALLRIDPRWRPLADESGFRRLIAGGGRP